MNFEVKRTISIDQFLFADTVFALMAHLQILEKTFWYETANLVPLVKTFLFRFSLAIILVLENKPIILLYPYSVKIETFS